MQIPVPLPTRVIESYRLRLIQFSLIMNLYK